MPHINKKTKELLAKLMATENIKIQHKQINTAMFDIENRVLYLPIWKDMSNALYTMFITHEVGHALYTPFKEHKEAIDREPKLGFLLNLVEDARIDKKMKVRFPGVRSHYSTGTHELLQMDFFEIQGKPIADITFLNRINLFYKAGIYGHMQIPFNEEEQPYIDEINKAITYKDVVRIAESLLKYLEDHPEEQSANKNIQIETLEAEAKNMKTFRDVNATDIVYLNFPKWNLKNYIVPHLEVHKHIRRHLEKGAVSTTESLYNRQKISNSRVVNYLVQEFELKKSAAIHAKIREEQTGVLNTNRLHQYKYTEDIFKKSLEVPEGKNHGLIIFLDCSGSMETNMKGTIYQLMNIVSFCRKINIPYDVYGFSDNLEALKQYHARIAHDPKETYRSNDIIIDHFCLRQYFSSKMTSIQHLDAMVNMTGLAEGHSGRHGSTRTIPTTESLGGTPFDEALMLANPLIEKMKADNQLDIIHTVILTDGYGNSGLCYHGQNGHHESTNRKEVVVTVNHRDYYLNKEYAGDTNKFFLTILKEKHNINVVGFYLCDSASCGVGIIENSDMKQEMKDKTSTTLKERGNVAIKMLGWDEYYILLSRYLNHENSIEDSSGTKSTKSPLELLQEQRSSRVVLRKFVDKIARKKELTRQTI